MHLEFKVKLEKKVEFMELNFKCFPGTSPAAIPRKGKRTRAKVRFRYFRLTVAI